MAYINVSQASLRSLSWRTLFFRFTSVEASCNLAALARSCHSAYTIERDGSRTDYSYDLASRQSFFNSSGQRWKEVDPDGVATRFDYNDLGELAITCLDSNRNDEIDYSGQDRIIQGSVRGQS